MKTKHTPTQYPPRPWTMQDEPKGLIGHYIADSHGNMVFKGSDRNINAYVVKCVNSHDELVEALKGIIEIGKRDVSNPKYDGYFEKAKQALLKAER